MSKRTGTVTMILSILAILLSVVSFATKSLSTGAETASDTDVQYVLYVGTNDKDTNEPVFTREEAQEEAKKILLDLFGGYTIQEASGGWVDGDKTYQEYTLVIHLSDTDLASVHAACNDFIRVFHQSSILIQMNETTTEFYSGEGAV